MVNISAGGGPASHQARLYSVPAWATEMRRLSSTKYALGKGEKAFARSSSVELATCASVGVAFVQAHRTFSMAFCASRGLWTSGCGGLPLPQTGSRTLSLVTVSNAQAEDAERQHKMVSVRGSAMAKRTERCAMPPPPPPATTLLLMLPPTKRIARQHFLALRLRPGTDCTFYHPLPAAATPAVARRGRDKDCAFAVARAWRLYGGRRSAEILCVTSAWRAIRIYAGARHGGTVHRRHALLLLTSAFSCGLVCQSISGSPAAHICCVFACRLPASSSGLDRTAGSFLGALDGRAGCGMGVSGTWIKLWAGSLLRKGKLRSTSALFRRMALTYPAPRSRWP